MMIPLQEFLQKMIISLARLLYKYFLTKKEKKKNKLPSKLTSKIL